MIQGVIFTALRALVNDRCYPVVFPQDMATWPAIRYQVIDEVPIPDICGTDIGQTDNTRVQIDYVAKTHGAALALRIQGRQALATVSPPCFRDDGGFEDLDETTRTYRVTDDYTFYPSSEAS